MQADLFLSVTGLMALVAAAVLPWRYSSGRAGLVFWAVLAAAMAGGGAVLAVRLAEGWEADLASTVWLAVEATLLLFLLVSLRSRAGWRLGLLLLPYLAVLAALATLWEAIAAVPEPHRVPLGWYVLHVIAALVTFGLATLAAFAGLGVMLQELALKGRRPGALSERLPTLADGERLEFRLLAWAEGVLGAGIATGMALGWAESGQILVLDHKTVLSFAAFLVIGAVLLLSAWSGLRGRRAARIVLAGYLLLTLAFPGVKVVTDVLLA